MQPAQVSSPSQHTHTHKHTDFSTLGQFRVSFPELFGCYAGTRTTCTIHSEAAESEPIVLPIHVTVPYIVSVHVCLYKHTEVCCTFFQK